MKRPAAQGGRVHVTTLDAFPDYSVLSTPGLAAVCAGRAIGPEVSSRSEMIAALQKLDLERACSDWPACVGTLNLVWGVVCATCRLPIVCETNSVLGQCLVKNEDETWVHRCCATSHPPPQGDVASVAEGSRRRRRNGAQLRTTSRVAAGPALLLGLIAVCLPVANQVILQSSFPWSSLHSGAVKSPNNSSSRFVTRTKVRVAAPAPTPEKLLEDFKRAWRAAVFLAWSRTPTASPGNAQ